MDRRDVAIALVIGAVSGAFADCLTDNYAAYAIVSLAFVFIGIVLWKLFCKYFYHRG